MYNLYWILITVVFSAVFIDKTFNNKNIKYAINVIVAMLIFTGCSDIEKEVSDLSENKAEVVSSFEEEVTEEEENVEPTTEPIDLSTYFDNTYGTAIFLTSSGKKYVYNEDMLDKRFSPYSTFKIVSTLIGLHEGIVSTKDSKMDYNNTIYWYDLWNDNLNLEQAFKNSCVWYYHQIINKMSQQTVQKHIDTLNYGNKDISEWDGNGRNSKEDLNGFWLDSSLEISPREQVYLLRNIFENETAFSDEHIELLQEIMNTGNIYAKTGSSGNESWYVGYFENNNENIYFAIFIQGEDVSGAKAKDMAISIIENWKK